MAKLPDIVPITDLRQDAAAVLSRLRNSDDPIVVTQRGRAVAVLQGVDSYEQGERERDILRKLAAGEQDLAAGRAHAFDELMAEAKKLLETDRG
jgi:prevent-host-death family protein